MFFDGWEKKAPKEVKLRPTLLWDANPDTVDYQRHKELIVQRVIERGNMDDFYFILHTYGGIKGVREIIKRLPKLSPRDEAFVLVNFNLTKDDLICYKERQLRENFLNS